MVIWFIHDKRTQIACLDAAHDLGLQTAQCVFYGTSGIVLLAPQTRENPWSEKHPLTGALVIRS